jgi:uncharacterized protein (TIGR03790 family)
MRSARILVVAVCLALLPIVAFGQTGDNVLVVVNEPVPASIEIGEYYAKRRNIPAMQVLKIRSSSADQVTRLEYDVTIQAPIGAWLSRNQAQDRILYIVLTKGVPLRISGTGGRTGTVSSVDSELALLYRRMTGQTVAPNGSTPNPYFLGDGAVTAATRFSHAKHDIFLVTRLDGFSTADAKALIDRGIEPRTSGRIVLDQRASLSDKPNDWLADAARKLEAQGHGQRVVLENTSRIADPEKEVLGYYSWGSNDPSNTERDPGQHFVPGALAAMFLSSDARTFTAPPDGWKPGGWQSRNAYYAASPQSLTGDLIKAGVTGVAGYVAEPYLDNSVRPDILFPAYMAGFTLAEAFYMALPTLGWQAIVVGDPLCGPFTKATVSPADLQPALDKETELPNHFSARRLNAADMKLTPAAKLFVRAESRLARGDTAGSQMTLEEAVKVDPNLIGAWRALGALYDNAKEYSKAIAAYRRVVQREPKDIISLNNLAYSLAVYENNPKEALPLAERALMIEPRSMIVADTVGWIRHLLGDNAGAIKMLEPAAKTLRGNMDVQLHLAVVYAELGRIQEAQAALKAAEAIDAGSAKSRPEYQQVLKKIGKS